MMKVQVRWRHRWFSRYEKGIIRRIENAHGTIGRTPNGATGIYLRRSLSQIRFYSDDDFDGVPIVVNDVQYIMHARGRFGRLYISE